MAEVEGGIVAENGSITVWWEGLTVWVGLTPFEWDGGWDATGGC